MGTVVLRVKPVLGVMASQHLVTLLSLKYYIPKDCTVTHLPPLAHLPDAHPGKARGPNT